MQQRGVTHQLLNQILDNADTDIAIGSNCRILRVHRRTAEKYNFSDNISKVGVVLSDKTGMIVTVMTVFEGRKGARYRRAHHQKDLRNFRKQRGARR